MDARRFNAFRHPKKRAFLAAYATCGNITTAAEAAKIDRTTYYVWTENDPDFVTAANFAREEAADRLEEEARRRAAEGFNEPVFYQGEQVGAVRRYSDTLLIFLLKGARPEKYADRHEVSGRNGGPVGVEHSGRIATTTEPFDFGAFEAAFTGLFAGTPADGADPDRAVRAGESVDTADTDDSAGAFPGGAGA